MGSLAQITYYLRIVGKIAAVIGAVALVIFLIFRGGTYLYRVIKPPAPPVPAQIFGRLPQIKFPEQNKTLAEYKTDTITGRLPALPDRMRIYKMVETEPNLFALQNVRASLRTYGFTFGEREIDPLEKVYTWQNSYGNTIKYNLLRNTFEIFQNPQLQLPPPEMHFSDSEQALKYIQTFLGNLNQDTSDIDFSLTQVAYFKIETDGVKGVKEAVLANTAQINLFQSDLSINPLTIFGEKIEKLSLVYPVLSENQTSTMSFVVRLTTNGPIIIQARYLHYKVDPNNFSDYPLKPIEAAFEDLQNGKAYYLGSSTQPVIGITSIALGYYIGQDTPNFAVPVIIFAGTNFKAYVFALKN